MGSNKHKQLKDAKRENYSQEVECEWANQLKLKIFACGVDFTLYATPDGKVGLKGVENRELGTFVRPRGLSALLNVYAFAHDIGKLVIGEVGKPERSIDVPESIVMTAICGTNVCALGQSGVVYFISGETVSQLPIQEKIFKINGNTEKFVLLGKTRVYIGNDQNFADVVNPVDASPTIDAVYQSKLIVGLRRDGTTWYAQTTSSQSTTANPLGLKAPFAFACVDANDQELVFLTGKPRGVKLLPEDLVLEPGADYYGEKFYYALGKQCFFTTSIIDVRRVRAPSVSKTARTATGRTIVLEDNPELLLQWNFVKGDTIVVKRGETTRSFEIVGWADGSIWAKESSANFVQAVYAESVSVLWQGISELQRLNHVIEKNYVHGEVAWIDKTPAFCASFGYEPDDLIWHESKGIVEFYGVCAGKLVLLDLAKRTLFFHDQMSCKVIRRASRNLPHTRTVIAADGSVVNLDISSCGKKLFLPADRVECELGQATVIGFANEKVYIQTDEMRMNGYEAVDAQAGELKLVRRIHGRADRKFVVNGEEKVVSLDTEDFVNDVMPGDKLLMRSEHGSAIGFVDGQVVVKFDGTDTLTYLPALYEIYYRADIQAVRNSSDCQPVNVGSPLFQESLFLPGDVVENNDLGMVEFRGCKGNQTIFVSKFTGRTYAMSYSLLMCENFFKLVERPAIPGFLQ